MSLAVWQSTITDEDGNVSPGASVRVVDSDTQSLVTLKPARDGSGSLGNPFPADDEGFARFYVADGRYDIRVTQAGDVRTHVNVVLQSEARADLKAPGFLLDTPASGTTHNYSPSLWASVVGYSRIILDIATGAGAAVLGGLDPTGVADGTEVVLTATHANGLTLTAEDATATAAWRIRAAFDLSLTVNGTCRLVRSASLSRWILLP